MTKEIICATDGSASTNGRFSLICSDTDGNIMCTNIGYAYGSQISPLRSECYGLLSILRFFIQLCGYHNSTLPTEVTIHTDSESMMKHITKVLAYTYYFPNTTLYSKCDIIQALKSSLLEFPNQPIIHHVKEHQKETAMRD